MPKAKAAAQKALELDDSLAAAYSSLAMILHRYEWDWRGAEQNYLKAIELNPNNARPHLWYAWLMMTVGRREEAQDQIKHAEEVTRRIDPLGLVDIRATMAKSLYLARQYDRAIKECHRAFELDPHYFLPHLVLGRSYVQKRMYAQAIRVFEKFVSLSGDNLLFAGALGHAYAISGRKAKALQTLEKLKELRKQRYVPAVYLAVIYVCRAA